MPDPNLLADLATIRQIDLQRVGTWMLRQVAKDLDGLQVQITAAILSIDPTGVSRLSAQLARLQNLLREVLNLIKAVFREIRDRLETQFDDLIEIQGEKEREDLLLALGLTLTILKTLPRAKDMLIDGATFRQWEKRQVDDLYFRVRNRLQDKVGQGAPVEEIVGAIKGTNAMEGEMAQAQRGAEAIVRTAIDRVPNEVTTAIIEEAPSTFDRTIGPYGWQQISILDSRTTEICRRYAYKIWDANFEPVGHKLPYDGGPPRHIYCRSRVVLIMLDDPVRPKTFKEWLGGKTNADQETIFGDKKMDMWRRGVITDAELIRQTDRQLTLDQYRDKRQPSVP